MDKDKPIIISLGGSLVVPNGGVDTKFLTEFNKFIRKKIANNWRFFIVVGGGSTARHYINAAKKVVGSINDWDLDWLGIHATRLNSHIIKTIFQEIAHQRIIQNYDKKIVGLKESLVIASGWKPGWSTDYDAVVLARDYKADTIINLSNVKQVYDQDPNKHLHAKPIHKINWDEFQKLVGETWSPGSNLPFDPMATKLARKLGLKVYILGSDLENVDKVFAGQTFVGTTISP